MDAISYHSHTLLLGAPSFVIKGSCIMQAFAPLPTTTKSPRHHLSRFSQAIFMLLRNSPTLPRKSHYMSNKVFHAFWVCTRHHQSGHGSCILGEGPSCFFRVPRWTSLTQSPTCSLSTSLNSACGFHLSNEIKSYTGSRAPTTVLWTLRNPRILIMWSLSFIFWYLWDVCYMPSTWEYKGEPPNTHNFKVLIILS